MNEKNILLNVESSTSLSITTEEEDILQALDLKKKVIYFLHIPKTSGTSLTSKQIINLGHCFQIANCYRTPVWLRGYPGFTTPVCPIYHYKFQPNIKISIIRNPFDLLCSYYHQGPAYNLEPKFIHSGWSGVNFTHKLTTFKEFIHYYCNETKGWHIPLLKQFLFSQLFDIKHQCVPEIIIKYEYINEAVEILNKYLYYPIPKKWVNKSNRKSKHYLEYYDEEMIQLVEKKCYKELNYFGYNKNGPNDKQMFIFHSNLKYDPLKNIIY